ncbi:MAG: intradiol ring-cleavage dioxygenase [Phormidesmis priestleyi]|uniref:Intradiol ring-cleavage dioxygenase n=1 Tax=Phormidesmis priestleyi TaxID=268141 RepID=A0A2W4WTQ3_9CYAN|nr:MAG: intradiol ring-cleavage dioxygenase [Phormidesmis priestleyi]
MRRSPPFLAVFTFAACSQTAPKSSPHLYSDAHLGTSPKSLSPTPTCGDSGLSTPAQTPGPFYSANSPQRQSLLEADTAGSRLIVTGQVLTTDCVPLANSLIDVWQTDAQGRYDNTGNKLRGHQFTDVKGRYWLETIVPGLYPGRTRHLHIKVQAPNRPVLTTQLYLPEEPLNESDFLFQPELIMAIQDTADGKQARFDFVL